MKKLLFFPFVFMFCGLAEANPWGTALLETPMSGTSPGLFAEQATTNTKFQASDVAGTTWSSKTGISGCDAGLIWTGSIFAGIGGLGGPTTQACSSPDGTTWTSRTLPSSHDWGVLGWNGTTLCALNVDGNTDGAVSTNGTSWSAVTAPSANIRDITYNGTNFLLFINGQDTYTSTNCATSSWTVHSGVFANSRNWRGLWNGTKFLAYATNSTASDAVETSTNGASWSNVTTVPTENLNSVAWNGSMFCGVTAGGGGHGAAKSSDGGANWTMTTFSPSGGGTGVSIAYNGTVFAIVTSVGQTYTTPDCVTFTSRIAATGDGYGVGYQPLAAQYLAHGTY